MLGADLAAHAGLDLVRHRDRVRQALRAERPGRAGDVHDAQHRAVEGMAHRGGGAGPGLHLAAEVLGRVDLDGRLGGDGGADGVGADLRLAPSPAPLQLDRVPEVQGAGVAAGVQHDAGRVGEDGHGVGAGEELARALQGEPRGVQDRRAPPPVPVQLRVRDDGRLRPGGRDPLLAGPLPGGEDSGTHERRRRAVLVERFPGTPNVAILHRSSPPCPAALRRDERASSDPWAISWGAGWDPSRAGRRSQAPAPFGSGSTR